MRSREIHRFKKALLARKESLTGELRRLRTALAQDVSGDRLERMRVLTDRTATAQAAEVLAAQLRGVEGALREIEEGTFGRCASCDRDIRPQRLTAVPWSPYCISCQEMFEKRRREGSVEASDLPYALAG